MSKKKSKSEKEPKGEMMDSDEMNAMRKLAMKKMNMPMKNKMKKK